MELKSEPKPRNPGPWWGYGFLRWGDRWLPKFLYRPAFIIGTGIALANMPAQRAASREYLTLITGRRPSFFRILRHFLRFADFLQLKIRVSTGRAHHCRCAPAHEAEFMGLLGSSRQALLGTFHVGRSEMMGFMLGNFARPIRMVRMEVANDNDTRWLRERHGKWISFLWVNNPENLIFEMKSSIDAGETLALQCDRIEHSSKNEAFQFLGARRLFPFTIYRLAVLFNLPVILSFGIPDGPDSTIVVNSPVFEPDLADRAGSLRRAHAHFQDFLIRLEEELRRDPDLWFNFLPLNPPADPATAPKGT